MACGGAIALHSALVLGLGIPPWHYVVIYYAFGLSWSSMQYVHHFGTPRHVLNGTRNLWIWAPLDLVWLNHNQHLAHHCHPTVPWIYLPGMQRTGEEPRFMIPHYLRMWRGPRLTSQHVENKYAGRVIR